MKDHKKLEAWQATMNLVQEIYNLTRQFPSDERYGLTSQLNRSAVSVPSNIAEGIGRKYPNEALHFFFVSRGSLYELETLLEIACRNKFFEEEVYTRTSERINECLRILNGLIRYFKSANLNNP